MTTLAIDAVAKCDRPTLQAAIPILAVAIVGESLPVDPAHAVLDPRIRLA